MLCFIDLNVNSQIITFLTELDAIQKLFPFTQRTKLLIVLLKGALSIVTLQIHFCKWTLIS